MTTENRFFGRNIHDLLIVLVAIAVAGVIGCGGGNSGGGSGGSVAGSGGTSGGSGGATGSGGGSSTGGTSGSGGTVGGTGGAGTGGSGSGGAPIDAAGDTGGGTDGGMKSCAGNAISLSANGTNRDSDAAQARVVMNLMTDLPAGNANRTVEFWAYIKTSDWVGENNQLYMYGSGNNATFGLDFGTNPVAGMAGNHATLDPFNNGAFSVDSTAYLGITSAAAQWVHIAMTWDGTTMRTYVNGVSRIMSTGGGGMLATGNTPLTMGCNTGNMLCFNGLFDEVRVWKVARTDAEILANHTRTLTGNETGLVGYWKFDEAPGSASAADSATAAGHTAHPGNLMATNPAQRPTFVTPNPPAPIVCP